MRPRNLTIAIDVGNTNVVVGAFRDAQLLDSWRLKTDADKTADDYRVSLEHLFTEAGIERALIARAVVCSVVPPLTADFLQLCRDSFKVEPLNLEPHQQNLIVIEYENVFEVGADRLANAIAAREVYGAPAIIVDFGTATTVDAVSAAGTYLGGAIAPGILTSLDALFHQAAKLPRVQLELPKRAIGRNTVESIQSGTVFGYAGQIEGLVLRFKAEVGEKAQVIATGGLAPLICQNLPCVKHIDLHLTLRGLYIFAEKLS